MDTNNLKSQEIIYFSVNNWFMGRHFPDTEPFISWMGNVLKFNNDNWCKENKICVNASIIDMSRNFCVTATKEWVEKNCPCLLTDEYKKFCFYPDEYGDVYDNFEIPFLEYEEYNFGVTEYYEDEY